MTNTSPATEWPFSDPKNLAVFTTTSILNGTKPILDVFHDAEDGGWQFLDREEPMIENAAIVSLHSMVRRDPSICALADLPYGWQAWREHPDSPWQRRAYEAEEGNSCLSVCQICGEE